MKKRQIILAGEHELPLFPIGQTLTVSDYRPARVGSGYESHGCVTGTVVSVSSELTRAYGCSFTWRSITLDVE